MSGIYIHIPFCRRRCNYCDFYFITNTKLIDEYLSFLKKEISLHSDHCKNLCFETVYFGGGTPSVLSADRISSVINELHKHFDFHGNPEISMEANPEDFSGENFKEYKSAGIGRISFGVQSFIDSELKFLTRQHTSSQAIRIIKSAQNHFDNINLDVIYSLPGQKISDIEYSLDTAVNLSTKHISAYTLTYEEKTVLFKMVKDNIISRNTSDTEGSFYGFVSEKLIAAGYNHYEVSNFAMPGFECRHNLKYWSYDNYLGLGPSSHSFINYQRWNNLRSVSQYIECLKKNRLPLEEKYEPALSQRKLEFIMLSIRSSGLDFRKYKELFNIDFKTEYSDSVNELINKNYAQIESNHFRLSESGFAIADEIIARYF